MPMTFDRTLQAARQEAGTMDEEERERLSLLRRWMTGWETGNPHSWQQAWRELSHKYGGPAARQILLATECFLRALAEQAMRPVTYHRPCCGALSRDERLLVDMVTLRPGAALYRRAGDLLDPEGVAPVLEKAQRLAAALELAEFRPARSGTAVDTLSATLQLSSVTAH